ncbi:EscU/YscU/HrcU family type III secretion system export apparatus switch protein [Erwinia sp. V71]|uniref:EscU/YscU/HrcU family type III secretion system export apparatus switch protein n=1 Tax=Erwinia sp. V71 TaxID=3369424 RepID=UPI003F5F881D
MPEQRRDIYRNHLPTRQQEETARSKEIAVTAGLLTSLLTLPLCFPYYLVLAEESFELVNQIAMDLDDEGALWRLMLLNILIVVKFLATLLPVPLVASLAPVGWRWLRKYIRPAWYSTTSFAEMRRLFSPRHLTSMLDISSKCAIILALLYLEILHDLAGFISHQSHYLRQPLFHGLHQWHTTLRVVLFIIVLCVLLGRRR